MWEPKTAQPDTGWTPKTAQPDDAAPAEPKPTMYGRGQLPIPGSTQNLVTNQDVLDAAMMIPAVGVEGAALKGAEMLGNMATRAWPTIARMAAEGGALPAVAKTAGSAAAGATSGAAFNEGTGRDPATGAEIGAGFGAAAPIAKGIAKSIVPGAKNIAEGFSARSPEILDTVEKKYADMAAKHFKDMRASGVVAKPEVTVPLYKNVEKDVLEGGKLYPSRHGETMKVLQEMKAKAETGMDVEDLDGFRRDFSQISNKVRLTGNQEDGERARQAIESIDKQFEELKLNKNLPPEMKKTVDSLQKAQSIWSSRRKFETLSNAIKRSEGDPNKIKSEFDKILNNPKLHRGFSSGQMKAVEEAAKNTTTQGLLKMASKFGITLGTSRAAATGNIIPALEIIGGNMIHGGGLPGFAGVAGGTAAKQLYKWGAQGQAEKALQSVESEILDDEATKAIGAQ